MAYLVLTNRQEAFLRLLAAGYQHAVSNLLGRNHPTSKWFYRHTALQIDDKRGFLVMEWAERMLEIAKQTKAAEAAGGE